MSDVNWDLFGDDVVALVYDGCEIHKVSEVYDLYLENIVAVKSEFAIEVYKNRCEILQGTVTKLEKDNSDLCKALARKQQVIDGVREE